MIEVTYVDHMGDDLRVVNAARVSFAKTSLWEYDERLRKEVISEKDEKLINYLAKHEHFSPFNHTFITLHCKAPIFVARQLQKHEYMPWNEVSRRYVKDPPQFYRPTAWRKAAKNVKQGSSDDTVDILQEDGSWDPYIGALDEAFGVYQWMLEQGVCPEQARMVLPQSMMTEWYWSGTLKAWAKMYNLRIDSHAQKETQEVARQAGEILEPLFPVSWKALTNA